MLAMSISGYSMRIEDMGMVCGVGFNDGKYPTSHGGRGSKKLKQYLHWKNMIERCYGNTSMINSPSYAGASISENFKSYSYFYEWCENQKGFNNDGWHLDKDVLIKGNKIYSEDTCVFLPIEINVMLVKSDKTRGEFPIGASFNKEKGLFECRLRFNGKCRFLGRFQSPIQAHNRYKIHKEKYIKELAEKWKSQIDPRAYEALMNYKVEITD